MEFLRRKVVNFMMKLFFNFFLSCSSLIYAQYSSDALFEAFCDCDRDMVKAIVSKQPGLLQRQTLLEKIYGVLIASSYDYKVFDMLEIFFTYGCNPNVTMHVANTGEKVPILHIILLCLKYKTKNWVNLKALAFFLIDHGAIIQESDIPLVQTLLGSLSDMKGKVKKRLTQIEAFLTVWFDIDQIHNNFDCLVEKILKDKYAFSGNNKFALRLRKGIEDKDIPLYVNMIVKMNEREKEFEDCYAFYHAYGDMVDLVFDFQTTVKRQLEQVDRQENIMYLRYKQYVEQESIDDFIDYWDERFKDNRYFKKYIASDPELECIPNRWSGYVRPLPYQLLSVNFCPLANADYIGKSSLYYFIKNQSVLNITKVLHTLFQEHHFDKVRINDLISLHQKYITPHIGGHMLQIFIPKNCVDKFVFLAMPYSTPFRHKIFGVDYNVKKMRHTNSSEFLHIYTTNPFLLSVEETRECAKYLLNRIEGRIVFLPDFHDAVNHITMFKYDFVDKKQRALYKDKLQKIVTDLIAAR